MVCGRLRRRLLVTLIWSSSPTVNATRFRCIAVTQFDSSRHHPRAYKTELVSSSDLVGEELGSDGGKLLVVLEDPTMTGVAVDEQLTALDAVMQVL